MSKVPGKRPIIGNTTTRQQSTYGSTLATPVEPVVKLPDGEPLLFSSALFEFIVTDTEVCVYNKNTKKTVFLITKDEIVIGIPGKECITIPLA